MYIIQFPYEQLHHAQIKQKWNQWLERMGTLFRTWWQSRKIETSLCSLIHCVYARNWERKRKKKSQFQKKNMANLLAGKLIIDLFFHLEYYFYECGPLNFQLDFQLFVLKLNNIYILYMLEMTIDCNALYGIQQFKRMPVNQSNECNCLKIN